MAITQQILDTLSTASYKSVKLDLSNQSLSDQDVEKLAPLLLKNPKITNLDLSNNQLTSASVDILVHNTTLRTLKLKPGNPKIKLADLSTFKTNTTLTSLPFQGGGPNQKELRDHIKNNANQTNLNTNKAPAKLKQKATEQKTQINDEAKAEDIEDGELTAVIQACDINQSGQDSYIDFANYLKFDLEDFDSDCEYMVWYMAVALNLYMHNASHNPLEDHGKAQKIEAEHALYYARSQDKHPLRTVHDKLVKNKEDNRSTSVFPLNASLVKYLAQYIIPETGDETKEASKKRKDIINSLNSIDLDRGFPCDGKQLKPFFGLFIAHAGLRQGNIDGVATALWSNVNSAINNKQKPARYAKGKLEALLPKQLPTRIKKLDTVTVKNRTNALLNRFAELTETIDDLPFSPMNNLQLQLMQSTANRVKEICQKANKKISSIKSRHKNGISSIKNMGDACLILEIEHSALQKNINKHNNHKLNGTNVLLSFLAGLINYYAAKKGLQSRIDRRQSFGFMRTTISDVGPLNIRISLGLEVAGFDEIIVEAITDLNQIISKTQDNAMSKKFTRMKSVNKHQESVIAAQYYLDNSLIPKNKQPTNKSKFEAFNKYLGDFICEDQAIPEYDASKSNKNIAQQKSPTKNNFNESMVFQVLYNTMIYASKVAANQQKLTNNKTTGVLSQSYLHALLKLYANLDQAKTLLNNINTYTAQEACARAKNLLDNIVEYLIAIDTNIQISEKTSKTYIDRRDVLDLNEKNHAAQSLEIASSRIKVHHYGSGQQAIITSLIAMEEQMMLSGNKNNKKAINSIYNFNDSYFELDCFLEDVGGLRIYNKSSASILFIDITQLTELKLTEFKNLKAINIDTTRMPLLDNSALKEVIKYAQNNKICVNLVCSCTKHEQLGFDKYTAGRITTILPNESEYLHDEVLSILRQVSNDGFHPLAASYLQMVNEICGDKRPKALQTDAQAEQKNEQQLEAQLNETAKLGLQRYGFMATNKPKPNDKLTAVNANNALKPTPTVGETTVKIVTAGGR